MDPAPGYFIRTGERSFLPQPACGGAWNPDELHIAPVNGVLLHELERWLAARDDAVAGALPARISLDYLGVLDFRECTIEFEVLRPGRAVELVEAVLSQGGRPALRARAWLLAAGGTHAVEGGAMPSLEPVGGIAPFEFESVWPGGYVASLDMRVVGDREPGRGCAWITTSLDAVAGEPMSALTRMVLLTDTINGMAVRQDPTRWQFPNLDLTIHFFRQPRGEWLGTDVRVVFGPGGHGLTTAELHDADGHFGHAAQSLLVRAR
jgi:hypothetical protein